MTEGSGPVLVTGASSGIGRAITEFLSENQHPVLAAARKEVDLAALARLPGVRPIPLDVTRDDDVRAAVGSIEEQGRGLYGLVNNAGIAEIGPLLDTSVEEMEHILGVNLAGMHRMVRSCFPLLARSRGRIVNIGSINGIIPEMFFGPYCISKFAVEAYSDVLREELSGLGIHVSLVEPGGFRSNITTNLVGRKGGSLEAQFASSPYREALRKMLAQMSETPGELDRSRYPVPRPVAQAVSHALFSETPKARYLVASREEVDATIAQVLTLLRQLNQQHEHTLPADQLAERLRSVVR